MLDELLNHPDVIQIILTSEMNDTCGYQAHVYTVQEKFPLVFVGPDLDDMILSIQLYLSRRGGEHVD